MIRSLRLEDLERLGWRFGLETIHSLLVELGNPHLFLRVVHVAGSNGKGSTCAMTASILRRCGYKTGLYTSPHLCDVRERFRLDGRWISPVDFNRHVRRVLDACRRVREKLGHYPTHFEALTATAFSWFAEQKVDWLVLEVGLGGRLDATNVVPEPAVSLITPISLEHQDILGRTLPLIAREKAGILKPGCLAATVQYDPEASRVIDRVARERGARLWLSGRDFRFTPGAKGFHWEGPGLDHRFDLPGLTGYQTVNAALALAGIQCLRARGVSVGPQALSKSLAAMRWPGRMEVLNRKPTVILDGAHNPDAARALFAFLRRRYGSKRWIVLNGFLKDKDYRTVAGILAPLTFLSVVTEPPSDRTERGERVFRAWERSGSKAVLLKDWERALAFSRAKLGRVKAEGLLITGSLYLVGSCRKAMVGMEGLGRI